MAARRTCYGSRWIPSRASMRWSTVLGACYAISSTDVEILWYQSKHTLSTDVGGHRRKTQYRL
eukprot:3297698-Rhodomonas_salina.1